MTEMAFLESHFSAEHGFLLTSSFCGHSKLICTDTALNVNGWSGWRGGCSGVLFLLGDYL